MGGMIKSISLGVRDTGFEPWVFQLVAVQTWASLFTSLSFRFFRAQMQIIIVPTFIEL